ncbi:MAG: exonuclease domain-containing protein, partial [Bacteroidota bacterium]
AKEIVQITQDAVFVAHNVRFDFSFLQHAFRRLGYKFTRKQLCTVKLSRKKMPGLKSYSLGKLCKHLSIHNEAAHRAMGDAKATLELFQQLIQDPRGKPIKDSLALEIALNRLPPNLAKETVDDLPQTAGVYYFLDAKGIILYVGKSNNIRKRILSHFQGAHRSRRTMNMIEQIYDLSYEETGSELIALLLENEEIKRIQPRFNRAQRRKHHKIGVYSQENEDGYLTFYLDEYDSEQRPLAGYSGRLQGEGVLESRGRQFQLCAKLYGAEKGPGRCFHNQLHICLGACVGEESPEDYNERARRAMSVLSFGRSDLESFLVVGKGREPEERSVVWINQGNYMGYGFLDESLMSAGQEELLEAIPRRKELPDVHRIIQGYIKRHPKEVISLPNQPIPY